MAEDVFIKRRVYKNIFLNILKKKEIWILAIILRIYNNLKFVRFNDYSLLDLFYSSNFVERAIRLIDLGNVIVIAEVQVGK